MNANCNEVLGNWGFIKGSKMVKSAFSILAVAAIGGIALTPVAASAATAGPAVLAYSSSASAGDPNTTVTFSVSSGALSMTAPDSIDLGINAPGTSIVGNLGGPVTVTDDRALLAAAWTAVASSTAWITGGGTTPETIPAGDVGYNPGSITTTGTITATGTPITLSATPAPVVTGTAGIGNNTAVWDPTLTVALPPSAVVGTYSGTLTQSVSLVPPCTRSGLRRGPDQ
jgi:hypothetical protein